MGGFFDHDSSDIPGALVGDRWGNPVKTGAGGYLQTGRPLTQEEIKAALSLGLPVDPAASAIGTDTGVLTLQGGVSVVVVRDGAHYAVGVVRGAINKPFDVLAEEIKQTAKKAGVPERYATLAGTGARQGAMSLVPQLGLVLKGLKLVSTATKKDPDAVEVIDGLLAVAASAGAINPLIPILFAIAVAIKEKLDR